MIKLEHKEGKSTPNLGLGILGTDPLKTPERLMAQVLEITRVLGLFCFVFLPNTPKLDYPNTHAIPLPAGLLESCVLASRAAVAQDGFRAPL